MPSVREDLATIKQQLVDMNIRQEKWYELLTSRIEKWDSTTTRVNEFSVTRVGGWDKAAVWTNWIFGILASITTGLILLWAKEK